MAPNGIATMSIAPDLGPYLLERFWGVEARQTIGAQMEYRAASRV